MQKEIDRFLAIDDDNNQYTVVILQNYIETSTRDGVSHAPGMKKAITSNGLTLNTTDGKIFEIVQTGTIIRKID
jgi:hypothetical protein